MPKSVDTHRITILTGFNAGYEAELPRGRNTIGGLPNDTIQLDGLDRTIAQFSLEGDFLRMRPVVDGITVNESEVCDKNKTKKIRLPARIQLNDETSAFVAQAVASARSPNKLGRAALFSAIFGIAFTLIPIELNVDTNNRATASAVDALVLPEQRVAARPLPVKNEKVTLDQNGSVFCTDCSNEALAFLKAELENSELNHSLEVVPNDGALRVTGSIQASKRSSWDSIRMAFDQRFAGSVPLIPNIASIIDEGAPFSIATVWFGEPKEFTTAKGALLRVGDGVDDGWTVMNIEDSYVELERGDKVLRIRF